MRGKFRKPPPRRQDLHRINRKITAPSVRLVGDNVEVGVYTFEAALAIAEKQELDLVEISPKADPPVCKVIDYKKFLYQKKKRDKELKAKTVKTVLKEVRFTPNTDEHDFNFKANHAEKFLKDGAKVKAYVQFKGRGILFKDRGEIMLLKFAQRLEDFGVVENMPKLEGRRMLMFIAPKGSKKK